MAAGPSPPVKHIKPLPHANQRIVPAQPEEILQSILYGEQWCCEKEQPETKEDAANRSQQKQQQQQPATTWLDNHRARNINRWNAVQAYHKQRIRFAKPSTLMQSFEKAPLKKTNEKRFKYMERYVPNEHKEEKQSACASSTAAIDIIDQRWFHWLTFLEHWLQDKWLPDAVCQHYVQQAARTVDTSGGQAIQRIIQSIGDPSGAAYPQCMLLFCAWAQHFAVVGMKEFPERLNWPSSDVQEWWVIALVRTWTIMHEAKQNIHDSFKAYVLQYVLNEMRSCGVWYWLLRNDAEEIVNWHKVHRRSKSKATNIHYAMVRAALHLPVEHVKKRYPNIALRFHKLVHKHQRVVVGQNSPIWTVSYAHEWLPELDSVARTPFGLEQYLFVLQYFIPCDATWCQFWFARTVQQWPVNNETADDLADVLGGVVGNQAWLQSTTDIIKTNIASLDAQMYVRHCFLQKQIDNSLSMQHLALAEKAASILHKNKQRFLMDLDDNEELQHMLMKAEWIVHAMATFADFDAKLFLDEYDARVVDWSWQLALNGYLSLALRLVRVMRLDTRWQPVPERIQCLFTLERSVLHNVHVHLPTELVKLVMQW